LPLLSVEKQTALKNYVEQGGSLIILGETGKKDQYNLPNEKIVLASLLGSDKYPSKKVDKKIAKGRASYIPLVIPEGKFLTQMKLKEGATTFGPAMADVFPDIPEGYTRNRIDPELLGILQSVSTEIEKLLGGNLTTVKAPSPYVEMTTMLQAAKNRMLVHLVNYDVTIDGEITTAKNIAVTAALPVGKKAKTVAFNGTLSEMKPVAFEASKKNGRQVISFNADQVNVYGLAVIEME
jgi:hypothetical protein